MSKIIKVSFVLSILLAFSVGVVSSQAINEKIEVVLAQDISFELDGGSHVFRDSDGQTQYPLIHEGSSYLPVRSVAEAVGVEIDWDGNTRTIILNRDEQDLDDTPYKDAQDYEPGEPVEPTEPVEPAEPDDQDFSATIIPPLWAEEAPSIEYVEGHKEELGTDHEIYLLEYFDSENDVTSVRYIITDLAYDTDFSLKVDDSDKIRIVNQTNESQRFPYSHFRRGNNRRTIGNVDAGEHTGITAPTDQTIQKAELRDMGGNVLWSYGMEPGEEGNPDLSFEVMPPQWAEESASIEDVKDYRGNWGPDYEIYLMEFYDSGNNESEAVYCIIDLEYGIDFDFEIDDRDRVSIINKTNETIRFPNKRDRGRSVQNIRPGDSRTLVNYRGLEVQRAEFRDMQGNLLWSYGN